MGGFRAGVGSACIASPGHSNHEVAIASIKALNNIIYFALLADCMGWVWKQCQEARLVLKLTMRLRTELECCYVVYSEAISIKLITIHRH